VWKGLVWPHSSCGDVNGVVCRCSDIHPDGLVYIVGCEDGNIHVYDVMTGNVKGTLGPSPGPVASIHCSQNGYWVAATSATNSNVRVWDLRKATVAFELEGSSVGGNVCWDHGGQYLALGGNKGVEVWAYQKKEKKFVKLTEEPLEGTGVKCLDWGRDGKAIVCGGLASEDICILGIAS
jgi:pre-mRNA-processing factor 19